MAFLRKRIFDPVVKGIEDHLIPTWNRVADWIVKKTGLDKLNRRFARLPQRRRKSLTGLAFISPWLIGLILFGIRPFVRSLRMSLATAAKYIVNATNQTVDFVVEGFSFVQYVTIFKNNPSHVETILEVFEDMALVVPLVLVFSLLLALMLNQDIKGRGLFRVIFFIPVILLSGSMLSSFGTYGLLSVPAASSTAIAEAIEFYLPEVFSNIILGAFGKIVLILWLSGVQTLIFLAGLKKMDKAVYEAAAIDGASMWDSFWKITLPALQPLMIINIVYTTVVYANLSNNGLVQLITQTISDVRFGRAYSSALAWILFLIELSIIGIYAGIVKVSSRRVE